MQVARFRRAAVGCVKPRRTAGFQNDMELLQIRNDDTSDDKLLINYKSIPEILPHV